MKLNEMKKLYCPVIKAKCKANNCIFCVKQIIGKDSFYCGFGGHL